MIKVEVKDNVSKILDRRLKKLKAKKILTDIARYEEEQTRKRIKTTKISADGVPWAPWSAATLKARTRRGTLAGGLLYETGNLWRSIRSFVLNTSIRITANAPYAKYLQNGTLRMPARPFLGWSRESIRKIKTMIARGIK
jgi:phage virion morphogenesis protein